MKNCNDGFFADLKKLLELDDKDVTDLLIKLTIAKDDKEELKKIIATAKKIDIKNMDMGTELWLEETLRYLKETYLVRSFKDSTAITEKDRAKAFGLSEKEFQEIFSLPGKGFYKWITKSLPKPAFCGRIRSLLGPLGKFFVRCKNCEYNPISLVGDCPNPDPLRGEVIAVKILTKLRFYCRYYKGEFPLWRGGRSKDGTRESYFRSR